MRPVPSSITVPPASVHNCTSSAAGNLYSGYYSKSRLLASNLIDPSDRPGPVVFEAHNLAATLEHVDFDAFISLASSVVSEGDMRVDSLRFGSIEATNINCKLRLHAREVFFSNVRATLYDGSAA